MIRQKGMCSVTFRELTVEEIVGLTKASGLNCIEWGSDVHVPVGDLQNAKRVKALTEEQGLNIYSYGSYFRCNDVIEFEKVSKTAQELGAKIIRVWAGEKDADECSDEDFEKLVSTVQKCSEIAKCRNQTIAFEYHFNTYNKNAENSLKLLKAIAKNNVKTYWQPMYWNQSKTEEQETESNVDSIRKLKEYIVCAHIYNWKNGNRLLLDAGKEKWKKYNEALPDCFGYLEFVKDGNASLFQSDANCLLNEIK